jgi:hypothetical protein
MKKTFYEIVHNWLYSLFGYQYKTKLKMIPEDTLAYRGQCVNDEA